MLQSLYCETKQMEISMIMLWQLKTVNNYTTISLNTSQVGAKMLIMPNLQQIKSICGLCNGFMRIFGSWCWVLMCINMVSKQVTINLNMLGPLMECLVLGYMDRWPMITIKCHQVISNYSKFSISLLTHVNLHDTAAMYSDSALDR